MEFQQILCVLFLVSGFPGPQAVPQSWPERYYVGTSGSDLNITCPQNCKTPKQNARPYQKTLLLRNLNLNSAGRKCFDATTSTQSSSVYVLIQGQGSLPIRCMADSYSSPELRCSIENEFVLIGPVLIRAKAYRVNISENSIWAQSRHEENLATFTVPVSPAFCPYGEHANPFYVLVEVMTEKEYWKVDMPISMTDTVVPGAPENLSVKGDQITWSYPSSWPRPSSFFPLLFQVNAKRRDAKKETQTLEKTTYSMQNIWEFQVRCRDLYSQSSPWSAWSQTIYPRRRSGSS